MTRLHNVNDDNLDSHESDYVGGTHSDGPWPISQQKSARLSY